MFHLVTKLSKTQDQILHLKTQVIANIQCNMYRFILLSFYLMLIIISTEAAQIN